MVSKKFRGEFSFVDNPKVGTYAGGDHTISVIAVSDAKLESPDMEDDVICIVKFIDDGKTIELDSSEFNQYIKKHGLEFKG